MSDHEPDDDHPVLDFLGRVLGHCAKHEHGSALDVDFLAPARSRGDPLNPLPITPYGET